MTRAERHPTVEQVREDFDRLALLERDGTPPAMGHHTWIRARLPDHAACALDLGCGTGGLARMLAERCDDVLGVDLSPRMIEAARETARGVERVRFRTGDLTRWPEARETFDVVTAVATLHHLPIADALGQAAARVRQGGLLLVVDLHEPPALPAVLRPAARWALRSFDRIAYGRGTNAALREAWETHGEHEKLPTRAEVRAAAATLPGAALTFRARWRWTLEWRRP